MHVATNTKQQAIYINFAKKQALGKPVGGPNKTPCYQKK